MNIKEKKNLEIMQNFTLKNIPELDTCVLGALELLASTKLPKIKFPKGKTIVVGSGNALATGKIIFRDEDAVFASESDYESKIKHIKFDIGVVISASGGKHAPGIIKKLKSKKVKTYLVTNNENAPAKEFADETFTLPKQKEPYTYNTSTYMGSILSHERENPKKIYKHLQKLKIPSMKKYDAFYLMLPKEFDAVREMFVTKFDELFGPMLMGRVYTVEQTKHAKTVTPYKKELFISFGTKNKVYGKNRLFIPLPKNCGFAGIMATGYYVIGKIQKQKEPYFKKNIVRYTQESSKIFGENIKPIVE